MGEELWCGFLQIRLAACLYYIVGLVLRRRPIQCTLRPPALRAQD